MRRVPGWVGGSALAASTLALAVAAALSAAADSSSAPCASGRYIGSVCLDIPGAGR